MNPHLVAGVLTILTTRFQYFLFTLPATAHEPPSRVKAISCCLARAYHAGILELLNLLLPALILLRQPCYQPKFQRCQDSKRFCFVSQTLRSARHGLHFLTRDIVIERLDWSQKGCGKKPVVKADAVSTSKPLHKPLYGSSDDGAGEQLFHPVCEALLGKHRCEV